MTVIGDKTAGLTAFVSAVETGSFSAASERLGTTPSAISKKCRQAGTAIGDKTVPALDTIAYANG
jgi:DNA-binding transcriptional LysR family regulator